MNVWFYLHLKTDFTTFSAFNPLPDMPILGFSNSAANKDTSPKYGQIGIQLSDW